MFHGNFNIKIQSRMEEVYALHVFIPYSLYVCATIAIKMTNAVTAIVQAIKCLLIIVTLAFFIALYAL